MVESITSTAAQEADEPAILSQQPTTMPVLYGELSILGYNGYVPHVERNNRRNRSKFLLCKRPTPNGIKKSRHYIVQQPQATKAIQDKDLHSISYTFSRSQTIIVEYHQDENTDMFQIGRSSEEPIDFVVMDTAAANLELLQQQQQHHNHHHHHHHQHSNNNNNNNSNNNHHHHQPLAAGNQGQNNQRHYHHSENNSRSNQHLVSANDLVGLSHRHQRHLAKVTDGMLQNYNRPYLVDIDDSRSRLQHYLRQQAVLLNYHQPNPSQIRMVDPFRHNNNNISNPSSAHLSRESIPKRSHATQSTISRFACRILVDRNPPYTAKIYAAGFDSSKNIFLGEKATKWEQDNTIDGLTTNGVLLMHPNPDKTTESGVWREVSVDGGIYAIRESRSATQKGIRIEDESNVLQDGTLIDLCGATLLWRSVDGFKASPTKKTLEEKLDLLNASRPQCPVGLNTLVIPRKPILPNNSNSSREEDKSGHQPYVYLKCGHVQGYHDWGTTDKSNQRTCPICLSIGTVAKLSMGLEPSFCTDSGPLTHVFNPCGHMASEKTVKYWSSVEIPHGTHFFHSVCPFCATPLASGELGFTRLIFQDDLD